MSQAMIAIHNASTIEVAIMINYSQKGFIMLQQQSSSGDNDDALIGRILKG